MLPLLLCTAFCAGAQDVVPAWYSLQPGNSWVYAKEFLYGRMDRPSVERWTTEETVVSVTPAPAFNATLVTKRVKVLDHSVPPDFIAANDSTRRELPESHLLISGDCVYVIDGADAAGAGFDRDPLHSAAFRADFRTGQVPPDFCFPMASGAEWGRVANTSPAEEYVWRVDRLNGDPFGPPEERTFHLSAHIGSGEAMDRWFTDGIGLVQENSEHHGTYEERRVRLLRSTIGSRMRTWDLPPARTVPLSDYDCRGPGWQHFVRADGTPFQSESDCLAGTRRRSR